MKRILFLGTDNASLSQMAEIFLKRITFNRVEVSRPDSSDDCPGDERTWH